MLAVFSLTPSSPKLLFSALFLQGRLPRWTTQSEPLCHWAVVRCSQGWDQPEMAAEGASVPLVSYLQATLTRIWLHYTPPTLVHRLPMVKLLGASASFVGTLNSGHTPEIISLKTLLMSHQSGILFLLWPWVTQTHDADVI